MTTTPWADARDLAQLGELVAQWLEGTLDTVPGFDGPPDDETLPLVPALAQINRAGFVTTDSQPGERSDQSGSAQRASVEGFCSDEVFARLTYALGPTDLVCFGEEHGRMWAIRIPVSLDAGEQSAWVGGSYDDSYLEVCYDTPPLRVHPDGIRALRDSWFVTAFDPEWGRNDRLWPALVAALTG